MLLAAAVDSRQIMGVNAWLKPIKFAVSIAIYAWTIAWFLPYPDVSPRVKRTIAGGITLAMLVEIACITLQAGRGTTSHYNVSSVINIIVFNLMGTFIFVNTLLAAWLLVLSFTRIRIGVLSPAYLWGIRLGLLIFVGGSIEGAVMIGNMAHSIGVPDGGPGLPIVNWSTRGGDLRAAHALGLHALQLLPLAGWWIDRRVPPHRAIRLMAAVAAVYILAFTGILWLALAGRPLLAV
jgi:hypothetical protein